MRTVLVLLLCCLAGTAWGKPKQPPRRVVAPLHIVGMLQLQFNQGTLGARAGQVPVHTGLGPLHALSDLEIRRLRLGLEGGLTPDVDFKVELQYVSRLGLTRLVQPRFNDAYIDWRLWERPAGPSASVSLRSGLFATRFGMEGLRSASLREVIELTDVTAALYSFRDVGLNLQGRSGIFRWNAGIYNGEGQRVSSLSLRRFVGKMDIEPVPGLTVGFSAAIGKTSPANAPVFVVTDEFDSDQNSTVVVRQRLQNASIPVRSYGAELNWRYRGLDLRAEYLWARGFNRFARADVPSSGGYVQAVYRVSPSFDAVLDYDWYDPDSSTFNAQRPDNALNSRIRAVAGVNYYIDRVRRHKIMLDYEIHRETQGPGLRYSGFRSRYQITW